MLAYNPSSQRTSFTDGYRTWLIGPNGLEQRLNNERLSWENTSSASTGASTPSAGATALSPPSGSATGTPTTSAASQPVMRTAEPSIDPRLLPSWNKLLTSTSTYNDGSSVADSLKSVAIRTSIPIRLAALPPDLRGGFGWDQVGAPQIILNVSLLNEDTRAVATVLAHELTHAGQMLIEGKKDSECIQAEVEAFRTGAMVWALFFDGIPPSRTDLETELTEWSKAFILTGDSALYTRVVNNRAYQHECKLYVAPGGSSTSAGDVPVQTKPTDEDFAKRCDDISGEYTLNIIVLGGRSLKSPKDFRKAIAGICREKFAQPYATKGVDCLELNLKLTPPFIRMYDPDDEKAVANATAIALDAADKCQRGQ
jgi:hypothetical protein